MKTLNEASAERLWKMFFNGGVLPNGQRALKLDREHGMALVQELFAKKGG